MLKLQFDIDNAAFDEDTEREAAAVLQHVVDALINGECSGKIRDKNGNTIGEWEIE